MMYHCIPIGCSSPYKPNFLKIACTRRCTPKSTSQRKTPKNATVTTTIQVVDTTSSRLGQVTCFISTRVSWRNSWRFASEPVTLPVSSEPIPPCDSSFFTFTACVAIKPLYSPERACLPLRPFDSTRRPGPALNSGRGGGIRTPIPGFGDRSPNRWTTPLNSIPVCSPTSQNRNLFHFFVRRLLAARVAKLLRFQTFGVLLLVLRRGVVAVFAFPAL